MAKYYIVEIGCPNCPNTRWEGKRYCGVEDREIDCPLTEFPVWCPLPDTSQPTDAADGIRCRGCGREIKEVYCKECGGPV